MSEREAKESGEAGRSFEATRPEDYPVAQDIEVELPSGAKAILHEPSKYLMLKTGQFPKDVTEAIYATGESGTEPSYEVRQKALEALLCKAFVSPPVSMTPRKGHLTVGDLRDRDREFVVMLLGLTVF